MSSDLDSELIENLTEIMDWSTSEAKAYYVLATGGNLDAQEIARRANIPQQRIYTIMQNLRNDSEDAVKKRGRNPAIYSAIPPKRLIEGKLEETEEMYKDTMNKLGESYEVEGGSYHPEEDEWILTSKRMIIQELREHFDKAEHKILIKEDDLGWLAGKDIEELSSLEDTQVKIAGRPRDRDKLDELEEKGIEVKKVEGIRKSYYVIDERTVITRFKDGSQGVVFRDEDLAEMFENDYEMSEEVSPN